MMTKKVKAGKEFQVIKTRGEKPWIINLNFYKDIGGILLLLSDSEWKNLINFFKMTKSKIYLPQDAEGYFGFSITKGKPSYYRMQEQLRANYPKYGSWVKNCAKSVKRTLLTDVIFLYKADLTLSLKRKVFLRFRKYCLNQKNYAIMKH
jgi:hypothetical protein